MNNCLVNENAVLDAANAKRARNSGIFDATLTMCDTFENEYTTAEEAR